MGAFRFAALSTLVVFASCRSDERQHEPNIVFVLTDDLGYGDLTCQNADSAIPTPEMDALARDGLRLTSAYSPSSLCSPTRYATLTGRYAWRGRVKRRVLVPWEVPMIAEQTLTLPTLLGRAGYHCAAIGKWHLGWEWRTTEGSRPAPLSRGTDVVFDQRIAGGPVDRGFDSFFGIDAQGYPPYCYIENDRVAAVPTILRKNAVASRPGLMVPGWDDGDVLPETTRRALAYLEQRRNNDRPFFLYLPLNAPHVPHVPKEEFRGHSKAGKYGDYVCQVDAVVGRIRAALHETGLERNTLLIVTSDNGSGAMPKGHDSNGAFRGGKGDVYEGGVRVPFLACWPGRVPAGVVSDEVVCLVDMMATFAALAGVAVPERAAEDSHDVLPILLGLEHDRPVREATVFASARGTAIRKGRWKLIQGAGRHNAAGKPGVTGAQLFDLSEDPGETTDLHDDRPDVVAELARLLRQYQQSGRSVVR